MRKNSVIWPVPIRNKLLSFQSPHFTPEETFDFITPFILETDEVLLNPILSKSYTEEFGEYKRMSPFLIKRFKVYYEQIGNQIIILGVKFPGEK